MARDSATIAVSAPSLMRGITLRVRFARLAGARLWLAMLIMRLAGFVSGCAMEVSTDGDQELEFSPDGIPRALSTLEGYKGFRRDAADYGRGLIIKLNGAEVDRAFAYDIDAGRVSAYASTDDGSLKLATYTDTGAGTIAVEHHKGVVTVERKPA